MIDVDEVDADRGMPDHDFPSPGRELLTGSRRMTSAPPVAAKRIAWSVIVGSSLAMARSTLTRRIGGERRTYEDYFDIDCTPAEARAFLGLPDLTPLHESISTR